MDGLIEGKSATEVSNYSSNLLVLLSIEIVLPSLPGVIDCLNVLWLEVGWCKLGINIVLF
jgi:hypothetical protein